MQLDCLSVINPGKEDGYLDIQMYLLFFFQDFHLDLMEEYMDHYLHPLGKSQSGVKKDCDLYSLEIKSLSFMESPGILALQLDH